MRRVLISILTRVKGNVNANGTIGALTEIKKFFTSDGETRVFVSGRCVKYSIKQRLLEKGFELSPLQRSNRVLLPKCNPILYIDDDLFGYMEPEGRKRRFAPIKTDGIVALRHCEISKDFGARFDPEGREDPSPFEVEVADFVGQNNWILTENVGKFVEGEEIDEEIIKSSTVNLREVESGDKKCYVLPTDYRKERLKVFLEVLLKERYVFPRSATGLCQPHYYYAVILLTERLMPLFAYVDYKAVYDRVILNWEKIRQLSEMLEEEERIKIVDFEGNIKKDNEENEKEKGKIEIVGFKEVDTVIEEVVDYLVGSGEESED